MQTTNTTTKKMKVTGWVLSIIPILFLLMDGAGKLAKPDVVVQGTLQLGYAESSIGLLGVLTLICTILYAIPRTSFIGAVVLTGYLGGAVATHVRVENPLFSHVLFPVYLGIFIWVGLYLRNGRLRTLVTG
jgi:hypothetical protein